MDARPEGKRLREKVYICFENEITAKKKKDCNVWWRSACCEQLGIVLGNQQRSISQREYNRKESITRTTMSSYGRGGKKQ